MKRKGIKVKQGKIKRNGGVTYLNETNKKEMTKTKQINVLKD
jgi:hypothetical protein